MPEWTWVLERDEVVARRRFEARPGAVADWPEWLPAESVASIQQAGIERPWQHQRDFAQLAFDGHHAAITTPTGSGKTLAYLMPVLAATTAGRTGWQQPGTGRRRLTRPRPTALYLAPTKALAHDQTRAARELGPGGWRVASVDGDSDAAERRYAREYASLVLTNPDMLHASILPGHERWSVFLSGLSYVVVDEAHRYQGVFGAHVSNVLRRLRRICLHYGSAPVMLLSSATVPNASQFGGALVGEESVAVVDESAAPSPARTLALWQPDVSLRHDTAELLSGLSDDGVQTLAFVPSRAGAELVSAAAQDRAAAPGRIASYRSGYLALDRRALEAALHRRELTGLATTNALELGVDVSGVDAVLVSGYPGRLSSLHQQAGRAGRAGQEALAVLLAADNPLDAYLMSHPELVFDAPVEHAVCHHANPHVLGPHLAAAAQEHPLSAEDERWFGAQTLPLLGALTEQGVLRDRGGRWFWTRPDRAVDHISLRSSGALQVEIIERDTGRVIGTVNHDAACRTVHPEAVYLHQGETWLVTDLDLDEGHAFVVPTTPTYYTQPQGSFDIDVVQELQQRPLGVTSASFGEVRLTSQVQGYLRRDQVTHDVLDATALDLPQHTMTTHAVWWTVPESVERELGWAPLRMGAALHAVEHTSIGLLPLFAPCDRWDIGGLSTALHPDTLRPTVFVHDGLPGGSGFAQQGHALVTEWMAATLERLTSCGCEAGCPSCIVSPKCGNANQVLDKADATTLLRLLLA